MLNKFFCTVDMQLYRLLLPIICISASLADDAHCMECLENKIAGGSPAMRGQFPYQVSIQLNREHNCGGSILTQGWILTAAHCCFNYSPESLTVIAGMLLQQENHRDVQISNVRQSIIHPQYPGGNTKAQPFDIAVVQLISPLQWTTAVKPIALPQENEEFDGFVVASGWGSQSQNSGTPTALQHIQMQIWDLNQCARVIETIQPSAQPLNQNMICAGGTSGESKSMCAGDSGGPLVQNGKLIGVTSWYMKPCGRPGLPSVFTKVSKYLDFIRGRVPGV